MTRETLLAILPPSTGHELTIVEDQTVRDIVKEVLDAHEAFAGDYDLIAQEFSYRDYRATLKGLFDFCKKNLRNDTESEDLQTTASPTILLEKGHCDCKGYAGFIGGVLDALNRVGYKYKWCYRFAQYDDGDTVHYHVFIVVKMDGEEIWVDPVLDTFNQQEPAPDRYFDRKKSTMTLVRMSGVNSFTSHQVTGSLVTGSGAHFSNPGGAPSPLGGYATMGLISTVFSSGSSGFAQLTPAGTALATANLAAANAAAAAATTTGAQTAAASGELVFKEARAGLLLPAIPGYPPDLPQLQLTPSGRLCFYNWPLTLTNKIWTDLGNKHQPIAAPFSTLDWTNTFLRLATLEQITQADYNVLKADFTSGMDPFDFSDYNTSPGLAAGWYKLGRPHYWLFQNVQYYIDRYLKNPYGVNALISYGTNWCDQFKAAIMGGQAKLKTYLEGCNFLVQPVGTQGFWDKFYLAAPLIISAAAAIVTAGAATPALLLAISNVAIKAGEAQAAITAARTLTPQGTPIINATNVTTDVTTLQGGTTSSGSSTISASGLLSWIQQNPLPAAGIGGALLLLLYGLLNKD